MFFLLLLGLVLAMNINEYIINKKIVFNYKECYLSHVDNGSRELIGSNPSGLLLFLIKNHGNTITVDEISNYFLERGRVVNSTTAIQYISKLRKTIKSLEENTTVIATIKGGGYYIPGYIDIDEYIHESFSDLAAITTDNSGDSNETDGEDYSVFSFKSVHKKNKYFVVSIVLSFILGLTAIFLSKEVLSIYMENVNYRKESVYNGCNVYIDHDFPEKGSEIEPIILNDLEYFCKKRKYAYLTYYEYSKNYSIIFCKTPIQKGDKNTICSSVIRLSND